MSKHMLLKIFDDEILNRMPERPTTHIQNEYGCTEDCLLCEWELKFKELQRDMAELLVGIAAHLIDKNFNGEGFLPGLGTLRECLDCGCIVAGGPTRCKLCAAKCSRCMSGT